MSGANVRVTFSTPGKDRFSWVEGDVRHVSDDDLAALTRQTKWALRFLDAECLKRSSENVEYASNLDFAATIEETAVSINKIGELTEAQAHNFQIAKKNLKDFSPQITVVSGREGPKLCRELCWQVWRWTNRSLTILLLASIGPQLKALKYHEAVEVCRYLYAHRENLTNKVDAVLNARAAALGLQESKKGLPGDFLHV